MTTNEERARACAIKTGVNYSWTIKTITQALDDAEARGREKVQDIADHANRCRKQMARMVAETQEANRRSTIQGCIAALEAEECEVEWGWDMAIATLRELLTKTETKENETDG